MGPCPSGSSQPLTFIHQLPEPPVSIWSGDSLCWLAARALCCASLLPKCLCLWKLNPRLGQGGPSATGLLEASALGSGGARRSGGSRVGWGLVGCLAPRLGSPDQALAGPYGQEDHRAAGGAEGFGISVGVGMGTRDC